MRAAQITAYGPSSNFVINDIAMPKTGEHDVLVKIEGAGVIWADVLRRRGGSGPSVRPFPYTMGIEIAGIVMEAGSAVTEFRVGDRVAGSIPSGAYAEYAGVNASLLRKVPSHVSAQQALVYQVNMPVAHVAINVFGKVQPGETLLVHAGAGGVGSMITQLAKRRGKDNTVIALASTEEKLAFCRENGADHVINYRAQDYVEVVNKLTDGQGVDVVFNGVGGNTLRTDPQIVKRLTGRLVILGASGGLGVLDPYSFIYRSIIVRPASIRPLWGTEERSRAVRFLDDWQATEKLIEPRHVFKLSDIAAAHDCMEQQRSIGKVVVVP